MDLDAFRKELMDKDNEYRRLYEEHRAYKEKLSHIRQKPLTSEEDEIEMKKIKLHKLSLKDQMEAIVRRHQTA